MILIVISLEQLQRGVNVFKANWKKESKSLSDSENVAFVQNSVYLSCQLGPCDASGFLESDQDAASKPLLHGAYNEEDSAAHFQEALMAWRRGEKICTSNNNTSSQQIQAQSTVRLPGNENRIKKVSLYIKVLT